MHLAGWISLKAGEGLSQNIYGVIAACSDTLQAMALIVWKLQATSPMHM